MKYTTAIDISYQWRTIHTTAIDISYQWHMKHTTAIDISYQWHMIYTTTTYDTYFTGLSVMMCMIESQAALRPSIASCDKEVEVSDSNFAEEAKQSGGKT